MRVPTAALRSGALLLALASGTRPAGAQEVERSRLSLSISAIGVLAGPTTSIASGLGDLGYDEPEIGGCVPFIGCFEPRGTPYVEREPGFTLAARYELTERWVASIGLTSADFGSAVGHDGDQGNISSYWSTRTLWGMMLYQPRPRYRFGGGLSVHRMRGSDGPMYSGAATVGRYTRFGLAAEGSFRVWEFSIFFLEAALRGHLIPGSMPLTHNTVAQPLQLDVSPSYLTFDIGVGLRTRRKVSVD